MENYSVIEALGMMGIVSIVIGVCLAIFWAVMWWVIFQKAGYSTPFLLGILMIIPIINIILFLVFALGEWPILRKQSDIK